MKNNKTNPYGYFSAKEKAEEIFNGTLEILNAKNLNAKEKAIILSLRTANHIINNKEIQVTPKGTFYLDVKHILKTEFHYED
jgi:hypothetical protein